MPTPPQVMVLATFAPLVAADWNNSIFDAYDEAITSLTATADPFVISFWFEWTHSNDTNASGGLGHTWDVSAYAPFYIMRVRYTFTFSELPNQVNEDFRWLCGFQGEPNVYILRAGNHLCFGDVDATPSAQALVAGTTYQLEIYIRQNRDDPSVYVWQVYLDGELALEYLPYAGGYSIEDYWTGADFSVGQGTGSFVIEGGAKTVTLTVGDVAWTIEDDKLALGRWTMLALL